MKQKPFIKKIKTEQNCYIYDVNTNHFVKVDDVIFNIIEDYYLPQNDILDKYHHLQENIVRASISHIERANREKGLFGGSRSIQFKHSDPIEVLQHKLKTDLSQMNLEITQQCNMRCDYCPYTANFFNKRRHTSKKMEASIYIKAIEFFLKHSTDCISPAITFYGGEPLLEFNMIEQIIEFVNSRKQNVHYGITTNGTLLNGEVINFILKNKIYLTISLDGPINVHDRYRKKFNGDGTHNKISCNMEEILKARENSKTPPFSVNITICPPYLLHEMMQYFDNLCFQTNCMFRVYHVSTYESDLFASDKDKNRINYYSIIKSMRELYKNQLIGGERLSPFLGALFNQNLRRIHKRKILLSLENSHYPNGTCFPGLNRLFIDADGKFYICERMTDFTSIGDVENGYNKELLFRLFEDYCQMCETVGCSECWAIRFCQLCYVGAKYNKKLNQERMKANCNVIKETLIEDIDFYLQVMEKNGKAFNFFDEEIIYDRLNNRFVFGKTGIEVK